MGKDNLLKKVQKREWRPSALSLNSP